MSCVDVLKLKNISFEHGTVSYASSGAYECCDLRTILLTILTASVTTFGVCSNGFVIFVLGLKNRPKKSDIFTIALAVSDVVTFLSGIIVNIKDLFRLPMPPVLNQVSFSLFVGMIQSSGLVLLFIAIDRYWAIARPLQFRRTTRKARILAVLIIFLATTSTTAIGTFLTKNNLKLYIYLMNVSQYVSFVLPLLATICLYTKCAWHLRRSLFEHRNNPAQERRLATHKRICQHFVLVTGLYSVSVAPVTVVSAILASRSHQAMCSYFTKDSWYFAVMLFCTYFNGCVNPALYARIHSEIKRALRKIVCRGEEGT